MSRRKAARPDLALPRVGPAVSSVGLAQGDLSGYFRTVGVNLPADEKEVIKEVPAKVDGVVVGTAMIYNDGSVDFIFDEDAPQDKLDKIKAEAGKIGYSIGGITDGPS